MAFFPFSFFLFHGFACSCDGIYSSFLCKHAQTINKEMKTRTFKCRDQFIFIMSKAMCSALQKEKKSFYFSFLVSEKIYLHVFSYRTTFEAVCGPELSEVSEGRVHESVSKGTFPSNV